MSKYKNEALKLKNVLMFSKILLLVDEADKVWDIVIDAIYDARSSDKLIGHNNCKRIPREYPLINSEEPDIYFESDGFVMGIEHFCIDSSKRTKRGSSYTIDKKKIDRAVTNLHQLSTKKDLHISAEIETEFSYDNYIGTVISTFTKHANHVETYKKNLVKIASERRILLAFYIEDVTTTWTSILNSNGSSEPLNPLCIREFVEVLEQSRGIDYIIVKAKNTVHILQLTDDYIQSLYGECYDLNKESFIKDKPEFVYSFYELNDE